MTSVVTVEELSLTQTKSPALPIAPDQYSRVYQDQLNNVLRLYFSTLDTLLGQLMATSLPLPIAPGGTGADAFGRLRVSEPYTLFDSQSRYAADNQFDVVKGLLVLATFVMDGSQSVNLTQRVGYFNDQNGVFFQRIDGVYSFVLRSFVTGVASDARTVNQSSWNGDKLDGTGDSGYTLDPSKAQILWMDFEWLGVGSVRCGFIINGQYIICHTFNNANEITNVYMTTAILPVRYQISSATTPVAASMKAICCSVISEGGFEQTSIDHVARRVTAFTNIDTAATFYPIVSIRMASGRLGSVVLPNRVQFLPLTSQNYEVALLKNPTLTGATWAATVPTDSNVEFDVAATAISNVGSVVQTDYITSTGSGGTANTSVATGYNWDLQLGASIAGVSDIYTLAVRTVSGATNGSGVGSLSFYDLTQ